MSERTIPEQVNALVAQLDRQLKRQNWGDRSEQTGSMLVGKFGNLVGATVLVEQTVGVYHHVSLTAAVRCTGFGCVEPTFGTEPRGIVRGFDYGELGGEQRLEALKWAQAHAETCRAMPKAGA